MHTSRRPIWDFDCLPGVTTTLKDIVVGAIYVIAADGPLTRDEIIAYARRYDPHPARLNDEAARQSPAGSIAASEWQIVGLAQVALVKAILKDSLNNGSPGIEEVRFDARAYAGDMLRTRVEIARIDPWPRRRNTAKVTFSVTVLKQDDATIMRMKVLTLWPIPENGDNRTSGR